jgi:hypothetical protein
MKTDIPYNSSARPRSRVKQVGHSVNPHRPLTQRLELYESMVNYDPCIRQSLNTILDALIASLGELEHPDEEINEFLTYNQTRMQNEFNIDLSLVLKSAIKTAMWAGFSVTEPLYYVHNGSLLIQDFVTYHPATITIKTNQRGRLTEGEPTYEGGIKFPKSGIYQFSYKGSVQLPLWKTALLINEFEFNNYYGKSLIEGCYRWHVLKEAYSDMMTIVLDRYGNPLTVVNYPKMNSGVTALDPMTGDERQLSSQEYLEQQLSNNAMSDNAFLFLPFMDANMKPDVKVLTGTNNLGTVFLDAIAHCEKQIARNLLIPYGFMELDPHKTSSMITERHIELFNRVIHNIYKTFVIPFISQTYHQMVKFNFNRKSAEIAPSLPIRKFTRPEDRVAMMQMIKGLTENGYFNPRNATDWGMVREMVDALDRPQEADDKQFIEELIIIPRQPAPPAAGTAKKTASTTNPERKVERAGNRTTEGKTNGKTAQGRPTGASSPKNKPS